MVQEHAQLRVFINSGFSAGISTVRIISTQFTRLPLFRSIL
jgi:hypothetical protein